MKFLCAVLALAALVFSSVARAECRKAGPDDWPVWLESELDDGALEYYSERRASFENAVIDVEATLPVGSVIATASTPPEGKVYMLLCDNNVGTINFALMGSPSAVGQDLYETGVPGVGYRVNYVRSSGASSLIPVSFGWTSDKVEFAAFGAGNSIQVELVKTGPMESESTVTLGPVARVAGGGDWQTVMTAIAQPVKLRVLPHCQVTSSKALLVDFGPFGPRDVSATEGPDRPVVIDVACDGPTPPNTVSASLMAQPDVDTTDFIKNDGTATGLAIRLRDNTTLEVLKPQDPNSVASKSSPGFNASFDMTATVLWVGGAAPTAGSIDAQAVVTLTFL